MRRLMLVFALVGACGGSSGSGDDGSGDDGGGDDSGGVDAPPSGDGPIDPPGPRLIPGPGQAGHDAGLAALARSYDRQFHVFAAYPFGLSLDALIPNDTNRGLVAGFLAQDGTDDFAAFTAAQGTPRTVPQIVEVYDEHGDLGMFAGAAAAGDAFRYIALRDDSLPGVDQARADLLEAIESLHIAATIVGEPGSVARGIRRRDEPGPLPAIEAVPGGGCPQSGDRSNRWRPDGSGMYPEWVYNDNNSKDQMIGYVFALGAFWDAVAQDPAIPQGVKDRLQGDARRVARSLMEAVPLGLAGSADLIVRDWRGCPTRHLDLNPRVVPVGGWDPIILGEGSTNQNGWNALAALGVMRTLYHVAGDEDIGRFYYEVMVGARNYPQVAITGPAHVGAMYQDGAVGDTNFSNVNMAFVAAYGVLRYESDPTLRQRYEAILDGELWDLGHAHDGKAIQQAFFNLLYAAFRTAGNHPPTTAAAVAQLGAWVTPPYWDYRVDNCDAGELAAGSCTAIDGTTQITLVGANANESRTPLPKHLRPPSNFEWRSDPRSVNGGGGIRLNPGGDFRSAYWMGRVLRDADSGSANVSPYARTAP